MFIYSLVTGTAGLADLFCPCTAEERRDRHAPPVA